jgi:hypothetical protein
MLEWQLGVNNTVRGGGSLNRVALTENVTNPQLDSPDERMIVRPASCQETTSLLPADHPVPISRAERNRMDTPTHSVKRAKPQGGREGGKLK